MPSDLLYIVEYRNAPGLLDGDGTTFELVLPASLFAIPPESLSGRRVWVVSRKGAEEYLAMVGVVEGVAEIEEERAIGDFLLELDKRRTFKTVSRHRDRTPWQVQGVEAFPMGLSECSVELAQWLGERLKGNLLTKIAPPPMHASQRPWRPSDGISPIAHELVRVNGMMALDGLAGYRALAGLSPIGAEVFTSFTTPDGDRQALLEAILSLDPLVQPVFLQAHSPHLRCDTMLLPLDPDHIFARKYHGKGNLLDIRLGLEKTQAAEKFHQAILRRLARGLLAIGVQPLATRSLDLAFKAGDRTHIVEIKTAHPENLVAQFLKGISQLLYYEAEMVLSCPGDYASCLVLASEVGLEPHPAHRLVGTRAQIDVLTVVSSLEDESPLIESAKLLLEQC